MCKIKIKVYNKAGISYTVKFISELPSETLNNESKNIIDTWIKNNLIDVIQYDISIKPLHF